MNDQQALARYRYMLDTAPPAEIERAHAEAFANLTPAQRQLALRSLAQIVPPSEITGSDPASLARTATRAELRQRGTIERAWGANDPVLGAMFLTMVVGSVIGTTVALAFFESDLGIGFAGAEGLGGAEGIGGGDIGGGDFGGGDLGGGFGGFGGF